MAGTGRRAKGRDAVLIIYDERDREDTDNQLLSLTFRRELKASLKLLARAQAMAWAALPIAERRKFLTEAMEPK